MKETVTKMHIITVVNGIGETSMPYNEFILYNHKYNPSVKQTILICSGNTLKSAIPDEIEVIKVGLNPIKIRKTVKAILKSDAAKGEQVIFHMHYNASAALTLLSTLGLGIRRLTLFSMHTQYPAQNFKNRVLNRISVALANTVVCVSPVAYDTFPESMRRQKGERMVTITNGVDERRIELALIGAEHEPNELKELAYVARIIPLKNHEFLLRVLKRVEGAKLLLIGADKLGDFGEKVAAAGLSDRVEITGLLPRDEVFRRIYKSDIYVSSSTIEGMPISVLEAMCCDLPVVLSDIPPHRQITEKGEFGISLPFDEDEWVKILQKLVNATDEERRALGKRGHECAKAEFSLDTMHKKYFELYGNLISANGGK